MITEFAKLGQPWRLNLGTELRSDQRRELEWPAFNSSCLGSYPVLDAELRKPEPQKHEADQYFSLRESQSRKRTNLFESPATVLNVQFLLPFERSLLGPSSLPLP